MKRILVFASVIFTAAACTPGARQTARDVLSVVEVACIIAHQDLPNTDVARVCSIADPYLEPMQEILAEARKASAEHVERAKAAKACP